VSRPSAIRSFPTTMDFDGQKYHESLLRSFQVLEATKDWLRLGTPPQVVLMLIEECYAKPTFDCESYLVPRQGSGELDLPPRPTSWTTK